MPCTYYSAGEREALDAKAIRDATAKVDLLTRMLCTMCKRMLAHNIRLPRNVAAWWKEHEQSKGHQR